MIIDVSSGKSGFKAYLEHGQKKGRDLHRDELDQRIPLHGNLAAWALACEDAAAKGNRYDTFTLSFTEDYVSDEMLQRAVDEFRDHLFAAWPEAERDRIPFYAEAHRPKIITYQNAETGKTEKRLTHIHIGVGRHDLLTGKHVQLTGYLGKEASDNLKYLDAFQESFNARYGFASPKLNPRITPETAIDILARYTGQKPDELGTFNERKADLETKIQRAVIDQGVTTWAGFGEMLAQFGMVSKVRAGKSDEAYAVTPTGSIRRVRLERTFFQRQFIERPTEEKVSIISDKARRAYVEQLAPYTAPDYLAETLDEWHRLKAREIRYFHPNSDDYKNVYLPADAAQREQILDAIERKNHGIESPANRRERQAAPARDRLPKLPVRNLDGVQRRSEMLLRRDHDMDVRADVAARPIGPSVRQADGASAGTRGRARGPLNQPSSVLAKLQDDLRERYEQAQAKQKFAEIRRNIDGQQLLARLSHSHGLQPEIYGVEKASDGSTRIRCGTKALSANDFLTKHLGMTWREAAPILREVYELQIGKRVVRARSQHDGIEARRLWKEFQASRKDQAAITERLAQFDAQTKVGKVELAARLRGEKAQALAGLGREQRKAVRAAETLRAATLKAEYSEARKEERRQLRPPQKEAWREFLHERAQAGDSVALRALRRLDDSARDVEGLTISGAGQHAIEDERKRRAAMATSDVLKTLRVQVERNGDVTFTSNGRAVLRDQGDSLRVLDPHSDEAIIAGLSLAQQMYGHTLTLSGPQEFQARVVALAVERGMPVKFADQRLEAYRLQLKAEKAKPFARPEPRQEPKREEQLQDASKETNEAAKASEPAQQPETPKATQQQAAADNEIVTPSHEDNQQHEDRKKAQDEAKAAAAAHELAEKAKAAEQAEVEQASAEEHEDDPIAVLAKALDLDVESDRPVMAETKEWDKHIGTIVGVTDTHIAVAERDRTTIHEIEGMRITSDGQVHGQAALAKGNAISLLYKRDHTGQSYGQALVTEKRQEHQRQRDNDLGL